MEFALSVGVFFFFVIVAIETLRFGFTILTAEYIVSAVAREAAVHSPTDAMLKATVIAPAPACTGTPNCDPRLERAQFIRQRIALLQTVYGIDFAGPSNTINICPVPLPTSPTSPNCTAGSNDGGLPDDLMRIELTHPFQFVAFGIHYDTTTTVVYRNQSYEAKIPVS